MQDIDDLLKQNESKKSGQKASDNDLDEKLSEMEIDQKEKSIQEKAKKQGLSYIDLTRFPISPEALRLIPEDRAREDKIICFFATETEARLASPMAYKKEVQEKVQEFSQKYNLNSKIYLVSDRNFQKALKRYEALPKIR